MAASFVDEWKNHWLTRSVSCRGPRSEAATGQFVMAGPSLGKVCNGKVMASSGPELPLPAAAIGLVFSRTERASANFKRQQVLINVEDQWNRDRRRSRDPVLSNQPRTSDMLYKKPHARRNWYCRFLKYQRTIKNMTYEHFSIFSWIKNPAPDKGITMRSITSFAMFSMHCILIHL